MWSIKKWLRLLDNEMEVNMNISLPEIIILLNMLGFQLHISTGLALAMLCSTIIVFVIAILVVWIIYRWIKKY